MNQLNQRAIAKKCANWVKDKVIFKTKKQSSQPLAGVMHVQNNQNEQYAYSGISGFTTAKCQIKLINIIRGGHLWVVIGKR